VKLTPAPSSASEMLESEGNEAVATLSNHTGVDFDLAYIEAQVRAHQAALNLIRGRASDVKTRDMGYIVDSVQTALEVHLREAKMIRSRLNERASSSEPSRDVGPSIATAK
jgi:putative membrane protein